MSEEIRGGVNEVGQTLECTLVSENGQWFAIMTRAHLGRRLAEPIRIALDEALLEGPIHASDGPKYRYHGVISPP